MKTFEFHAHATPSLYGQGSENEAAKLCAMMNRWRALNKWQWRETDNGGPVMDIAHELQRHLAGE